MIGLISDTHDNVFAIKNAVELFKKKKVDFVIHLGDIIALITVLQFKGLRMKFISGNCDGDIQMIKKKISEIDGDFLGEFFILKANDKKIAMLHGHNQKKLNELITSKKHDYIIHGHTHLKRNDKLENTRIINPGAFYPTVEEKTVAILDIDNDKVEFFQIN